MKNRQAQKSKVFQLLKMAICVKPSKSFTKLKPEIQVYGECTYFDAGTTHSSKGKLKIFGQDICKKQPIDVVTKSLQRRGNSFERQFSGATATEAISFSITTLALTKNDEICGTYLAIHKFQASSLSAR
jgi:hypothetical protein